MTAVLVAVYLTGAWFTYACCWRAVGAQRGLCVAVGATWVLWWAGAAADAVFRRWAR